MRCGNKSADLVASHTLISYTTAHILHTKSARSCRHRTRSAVSLTAGVDFVVIYEPAVRPTKETLWSVIPGACSAAAQSGRSRSAFVSVVILTTRLHFNIVTQYFSFNRFLSFKEAIRHRAPGFDLLRGKSDNYVLNLDYRN